MLYIVRFSYENDDNTHEVQFRTKINAVNFYNMVSENEFICFTYKSW